MALLVLLAGADTLYIYGNFAMAPIIFKQTNVIRVPFGDTVVTSVYVFLSKKTRAIYEELFHAIVDSVQTYNKGVVCALGHDYWISGPTHLNF